jgi:hypothetical protein
MKRSRLLPLVFFALTASLLAQSNPVPFLNQPLVPTAVPPGSPGVTLTVNGTGFVPSSVVNWNGSPLATAFVSSHKLVASVPGSDLASAKTASVTVSSPIPGGGTSNVVPFSVTSPTTSLSFVSSTIAVGLGPGGVVSADFNNDGMPDLAVVNENQPDAPCYPFGNDVGTISILSGNGDGTFSSKSTLCFDFAGGGFGLSPLVAGDFNGDGKTDLIASYFNFAECLETFPGNGDGTFASGDTFACEDAIVTPLAGDFNGDGKLDVAFPAHLADFPGIFVALGNGGGVTCCVISGPFNLGPTAAGDFNNDGILDLAVTGGNGGLEILLGNGDGTFTPVASQPPVQLVDPASMTAGDFNGDGILDLAIADGGSTALVVLQGNGDGTFTPLSGEPALPQFSNFVTTADLNGDGKLDLVFSSVTNSITLFLGNGDGTFQPGVSEPVGNAPQSVAIGDFNGDGRLDIAVTNYSDNTITILLQTSPSAYKAFVQQPINSDGSSIFRANRGVVPVKFRLTENGAPTCALPPATISVTRTAGGTLGAIDENAFSMAADSGSNFRIDPSACQYVYNLATSSLGVGTYRVDISIEGTVVGHAVFALK